MSERDPSSPRRLRSGLRRHGLVRRPGDIRRTLRRGDLHFTEGNAIDLYDCGREAFPAMLDAIAAAREFVHLETYILRHDRLGTRFLDALTERAAAGVEVRLLYDAIGSIDLDSRALQPLEQAGGDAVVFNPVQRIYPRWVPRRRDHRKLLVVDGIVAFTGGLNLGDEYDATPVAREDEDGWRDTHARVRGPVVRDLGAVFLESWFRSDGGELPWRTLLRAEPDPPPGDSRCSVLPDGPVYRRRAMRDLLVSALDEAQRTARLTSPYFAPDRKVLEALERAAERGVAVELILAGRTDHPLMRRGARSTVERLLRRGVVVHEYVAAMLHAKAAVFDGRLGVVGSSNLDRQSFQHNYEVNLVITGGEVPKALDQLFERDLGRSAPVTLATLERRGWWTRVIDRLASLLVQGFV